jgi:hypothetical protein
MARQLYYFTNDQWNWKRLPLPSIARRGLQGKDCKELSPVVLRINQSWLGRKLRTAVSVPLEPDHLSPVDLESDY